jgi:hypothetical protein
MSTSSSIAYRPAPALARLTAQDFLRTDANGVEIAPRQVVHATTTYDAAGVATTSYIDATTGANLDGTFNPDTELRALTPPNHNPTFPLGVTIVGPVLSQQAGWGGAFATYDLATVPVLTSFTVSCHSADSGLPGQRPNQILVGVFGETLALEAGQTMTWSIGQDQDTKLTPVTVTATGTAWCHLNYTGRI